MMQMNAVIVVLLLIIIIYIFGYILNKYPMLKGGEATSFKSRDKIEHFDKNEQEYINSQITLLPSVSQIPLISYPKTIDEIINLGKNEIEKRSEINLYGNTFDAIRSDQLLYTAKTVSDANVDLLGCFYHDPFINGFGVCEWNNRYRYARASFDYGNNIPTFVRNGFVNINKDEISPLPKIDKYIYIEFIYDEKGFYNISKAYENIHKETINILCKIMDDEKERILKYKSLPNDKYNEKIINANQQILIYRIPVVNDEVLQYECIYFKNGISIYGNTKYNSKFVKIVIPETKAENGLSFDEYIEFSYYNINHSIQIEHSEDFQNHKSNIVDFILYVCKHVSLIAECLNILGYSHNQYKVKKSANNRLTDKEVILKSAFYQTNPRWYNNNILK